MSRRTVAVIGGGANCEHEVGLASAAGVCTGLRDAYDVVPLTIARDGRWVDGSGTELSFSAAVGVLGSCDVVFPVVHGPHGEDGTLAALCDLAGVPFVGSGVRAGALAMDKWATKLVAEAVGVATAEGIVVTSAEQAVGFRLPAVVKPVAAGSSHGVALVRTPAQLRAAVSTALGLDGRVLVEELLQGREIDIAVLACQDGELFLGPPLEVVVPAGGLFDTTAKYDGSAQFQVPASLRRIELEQLEAAATKVFKALGCAGVARVDFFLTSQGFVLNEVNTTPGMTPQSQVPKMFAAVGMPYAALLDALVASAVEPGRKPSLVG